MKLNKLLTAAVMAMMTLTGWAGVTTGENGVQSDGSPSLAGQATADHLFVRGTYQDQTFDNVVSFDEGATKLVWLWLDDDEIYLNSKVQALTPIPYNRAGDLYNEITYNSFQCDLYLPENVSLVRVENEEGDIVSFEQGDRMPNSTMFTYQAHGSTKVIDGVTYHGYTLLCTSFESYGCHFSSKNAAQYETNGALKKDDGALIGLYLRNDDMSGCAGEMPNMIIANLEFGFREAFFANPAWEPNDYRFFYGSGGDNKTQRFQYYHRVRLYGSNGFIPTAMPTISYRVTNDNVVITATGDGNVVLMVNGEQVDNPCRIARGDEDYTVMATATAQEEGKDVSDQAVMTITVPAKPGTDVQNGNVLTLPERVYPQSDGEFVLPVAMTNTVDITALQCDLILPEGFSPVMEDGQYLIELEGDRVSDSHIVSARMLADGALRLLVASPVAEPFEGNDGDLFMLHVAKAPEVADGYYPLRLENVILADACASTYYAPTVSSTIVVKTYLRGDANGDGMVNVGDYVTTANYILAMDPDPFIFSAADVNDNETVDVGDLVGIVGIVMGDDIAAVSQQDDSFKHVSLNYSIDWEKDTRYVTLSMENDVPLTAWQMDLSLKNEGITLTEAHLTSRAANHTLTINDLGDGNVKLLSSSATNEEVLGHKGDLLTLKFECEPLTDLWVECNHILMAEPDMTTHVLPFFQIFDGEAGTISVRELSENLRIYGTDGTVIVESPTDTTVELINPNGMIRTVQAKAGVNTYPVERGIWIVRAAGQVAKLKF